MLATADETRQMSMPEFLRRNAVPLDEAVEYLRIDRSTVYRYIEDGKLARVKHGGRTWITRRSIDEYETSLIEEATKEQGRAARAAKRAH
ncbi:helix-turn-helix domain-containing protein [Amycolatopsis sp. NPDC021455]|uniref:helix-turn-helix domain-containing protein n=1 Tax=Amycolatopsis sp. NPDC021455 TaxID=3154901 RepID=UPI0033CFFEA3